ncbi:hypothetical protein VNO77_22519 [Canavalia gladiata]|uniref:Uncharacterized protein n=1 Tax=Canavalia gladiata TaxID=3824 RepID=A0AAN9QEJ0_CANGL
MVAMATTTTNFRGGLRGASHAKVLYLVHMGVYGYSPRSRTSRRSLQASVTRVQFSLMWHCGACMRMHKVDIPCNPYVL